MQRWACGVSYLGDHFHGWQKQPKISATIEQELITALSKIADEPINIVCAGRTDKGVHALGQVIHFDAAKPRTAMNWLQGVNKLLPSSIKLQWALPVEASFHARYSARARSYRYIIYNHEVSHPLLHDRVWWVKKRLDAQLESMQIAAKHWIGEHDFSSFRDADCQASHAVRTLHRCEIHRIKRFVIFDIEGNAFLHHMVRNMLGVLIEIGVGKQPSSWAKDVLHARDRRVAGITAPASGLYLRKVNYPMPWEGVFPKQAESVSLPL